MTLTQVCYAISSHMTIYLCKSANYRVCLFLCLDPAGVHCIKFSATPITAQLCFIHFWKAPVTFLDVHPEIRFWIFEKKYVGIGV